MRSRSFIWILLCLLCLAGAWFFWHQPANTRTKPSALPKVAVPTVTATSSASTASKILTPVYVNSAKPGTVLASTNPFAYRLSNTTKSLDQLMQDRHAILLENALIDSSQPLNFSIPKNLQSQGDPGAYIVQARGPIDNAFRAMLARSGAQIVSYIPNDAYLVRASAGMANGLTGNPLTQAVIPYEPYYKISSSMPVTVGQRTLSSVPTKTNRAAGPSLLVLAVKQAPLPAGTYLTLGLFKDSAAATVAQIEKLGGQIVARDNSPFGPVVRVQPPTDWVALAALPGVQIVEPLRQRVRANDLSRATVGVAADTQVSSNYMNLTGLNVLVEVNDFGIDATHPDLAGRVFGFPTTDASGHGTHVAGIIAGNGSMSSTVTSAQGSVMPATNGQFRGKAPLARLLSMDWNTSDQDLQAAAARTNALISNNSWNYGGDTAYDLAAASYDAAVRDALPEVTGSQSVLFVFSAGNDGSGDDDGGGGTQDTIQSPATAKNVITVGALEQLRNITNMVTDLSSNQSAVWKPWTDSSNQVAGYSSRGNVGVGTEGTYGRYKPDVVAPGTFVVSTRSSQWDERSYYNPTNYQDSGVVDQIVSSGSPQYYSLSDFGFFVPNNAVGVTIQVFPNANSASPFPNLPIYVSLNNFPDPNNAGTYDFVAMNDQVSIPPDGGPGYLASIINNFGDFTFAVVNNTTNQSVDYDLFVQITTTNDLGNYYTVLSNLNNSLGGSPDSTVTPHYYRYETGTSMSAADVSGVLALMQDYFTNTLHTTPSPALLKAMLINGARPTFFYDFQAQKTKNFEGWGLINLPNSLPPGITTVNNANGEAMLILDQSPANSLATGDSHQYQVTIVNTNAQSLSLRFTLAWTDPPGDPAAAIKLVNDLNLVVTNLSNPTNPIVYYGNDIPASSTFNSAQNPTNTANYDSINNVENVYLPAGAGTSFSVTVQGSRVNVNAVTAQTNNAAGVYAPNVVQDFALVISCGNGTVSNAFTVTDNGIVSNPTTDQQITYVGAINAPLMNQLAGASTPLLGTNTILLGTNLVWGGTNGIITLGMTNQWHFYVVTNTTGFTNAAFVTFIPDTLSIPRMGVFADSTANATRPEADIDLYVSTDPTLMNLNPVAISNCVNGAQVGASVGNIFNGASLGRGGTEFVADTNSNPAIPGEVYYVGVYSEDQEASEYGFIPLFSQQPFSQINSNGTQSVFGVPLPVDIPDPVGNTAGYVNVFCLALYPMQVQRVIVTNIIEQQDTGDLVGSLSHSENGAGVNSSPVILMNHFSTNAPGIYPFIYDDSGQGDIVNSQPSAGPGSLNGYVGQQGMGSWILHEADSAQGFIGSVTGFGLLIEPHQDLRKGITATVQPGSWFYDYIDVPVGNFNLTVFATNLPPTVSPPMELFVKLGSQPTLADTNEFGPAGLTNSGPLGPGNSISIGPPLTPGLYWVGIFNPSSSPATVYIIATLNFSASAITTVDYASSGPVPIFDDAVTYSSIFVPSTDIIQDFNVGLRVDHPRISDLVFHLISPDGTRYLLMENRGGTTTNGCGATIFNINNFPPQSFSGGAVAVTNVIDTGVNSGSVAIDYDFLSLPDEMTIYYDGALIFDSGFVSGSGTFNINYGPGLSTDLTIIMNQFGNSQSGTIWNYTIQSVQTNFAYLTFTEDTNLTTTPIKFAPPPFVPDLTKSIIMQNGFEGAASGIYTPGQYFAGGWHVDHPPNGGVTVQTTGFHGSAAYKGNNYLEMDAGQSGTISTNIATVPGQTYALTFAYAADPDQQSAGETTFAIVDIGTANSFTVQANYSNSWANLDWRIASYQFTATSNFTTLSFGGYVTGNTVGGVGILLDDVSVFEKPGNLYYLPEQDISALNGQSAYGTWTLEIQDDRAGDIGTLQSWQLEFVFANTNFIPGPPILTNGLPQTNVIPAGGVAYYPVTVPVNADFATNILLFSTAPKNIWFDTNNPHTTNVFLFSGTNGSYTLSTTGTPPLVPGSTYYLGEQNTNSFAITNAIEVDFHFVPGISGPFAFTQPAQSVTGTGAQLNGMATPNGLPATAWFQWGTNIFYGNQTPPVSVGTGSNVVYTASQISGLLPNVPYHFRLVVSNALAVVYGFDQILDEANVVVWGADYVGQANVPSGLSNVVAIAGAYDHSLALKNNGTAVAWGDNIFGQANVPTGLNNLLALAGGEYYSLALNNGGTVVAWGANILGQTNVPAGLNNVVEIAGGTFSSLALRNDGTVVAWGASFFGLTNVPAGFSNAVAIAGGSYHSLAIKNDGTVVAWGDDSAGQTNVPAGLTNVVAIAGGSYHSLALKYDGTVVAWGDDSAGQTSVPAGLSHVVAVAAGGFHSLALKNDGTVVAWGDNSAGQTSVPVGLTNFVAIAAGYFHSLALTPLFNVNPTNPIVLNLTNGVPQTNSILAGGIIYYQVNVPANADFATNILLFTLNGPLNVWLGTNSPATNVFLFSGTNGSYTLSTTGTPPLVPGSTYYLGVQNTNSFTVNYGIEVDFHLTSGSITGSITGPTITATNIGGTNGFLLQWQGPTNFQYEIQWTTNLLPLVVWHTVLNPVINVVITSTNGHFSWFDDGTLTGGFGPMKFYRVLGGLNLGPIIGPGPATNTVLAGAMSQAVVTVPANAIAASNFLISATGPLNVWFNQTNPPTGNTSAGDHLMLSATSAGTFVLTGGSVPPLVPGANYYLGFQNPVASDVTFVFQVAFGFAPTNAVSNFSITATNIGGTNGFLLQWQGPTNFQYEIQWTTNLAPVVWNTVLNPVINVFVTPTNGHFSFFDDGTLTGGFGPMKFYRVLGGLNFAPTNAVSNFSITATNGGIWLKWNGLTNYQYQVQWTTHLAPPAAWNTISNIVLTSTTGVFTFFDDGSLTGGFGPMKYYRLIAWPFMTPIPQTLSISSVTVTNIGGTNDPVLRWSAPTNYQYGIQWTTNLTLPFSSWFIIASPVFTVTNSVYTFIDNGQTGPPTSMKFFRLFEY